MISSFDFTPTNLLFSTPFSNTMVVGTERTLYCCAVCGEESVLMNVMDISVCKDSIIGLKVLHGPQYVDEKYNTCFIL